MDINIGKTSKTIKPKPIVTVVALLVSWNCFCQFPSTDSYELIREVPKAKQIGDTVYATNSIQTNRYDGYVLSKIDRSGRYCYREIKRGGKLILKVAYGENNKVRSYYYKYKEYGGEGKGYFEIHYYPNGNIKDYAHVSFYFLNQPRALVLYDSVGHVEKNPAKIPKKEYQAFYRRKKVYLFKGPFERKKIVKKIRKSKHLTPVNLVAGFPFKTYLLE